MAAEALSSQSNFSQDARIKVLEGAVAEARAQVAGAVAAAQARGSRASVAAGTVTDLGGGAEVSSSCVDSGRDFSSNSVPAKDVSHGTTTAHNDTAQRHTIARPSSRAQHVAGVVTKSA